MFNQLLNLTILFTLAILGFFIAKKMKFPAPALLGSILFLGLINLFITALPSVPGWFSPVNQICLGIYIGLQVNKGLVGLGKKYCVPFLFICAWALTVTFSLGFFLNYFSGFDLTTAIIVASPGGLPEMVVLGASMDADMPVVVLTHSLRLVGTIALMPLLLKIFKKGKVADDVVEKGAVPAAQMSKKKMLRSGLAGFHFDRSLYAKGILIAVAAIVGGCLANAVHFPAGYFIGSLVLVMFLSLNGINPGRPNSIFANALFLGLGITVAEKFGCATLDLKTLLIPSLLSVLYIFAASFVLSLFLHRYTGWDYPLCMMISAPAGLTVMTVLALETKYDPLTITIFHMARQFTLKFFLPIYFLFI